MPKDQRNAKPEPLTSDEKFRSFFTTTVVDLPKDMTHEDLPKPEPVKKGLFGALFGKKNAEPEQEDLALELPTGEILLGEGAPADAEEDMDLMLCTADPGQDLPSAEPKTEKPPQPKPEPKPAPAPAPEKKPEPKPEQKADPKPTEPKPAPEKQPEPKAQPAKPQKPKKEPHRPAKNAPEVLLPQEQQEQQEMQQLKDLLSGGQKKPKAAPAKPAAAAKPAPAAKPKPEPAPAPKKPDPTLPKAVFASVAEKEPEPVKPEKAPEPPVIRLTGTEEPEKPTPDKEDTLSLPLEPIGQNTPEQAPQPAPELRSLWTGSEDAQVDDPQPEEYETTTADRLRSMSAELTLRCVLAGILAVVLVHFGLVAEGLLPAVAVLDPSAAPAAFFGANLLLLAASCVAAFPVLRDGLTGLRGKPTSETMPALAASAALLQAIMALLHADAFRAGDGLPLLSGMAALGLFLALLGSRVMLASVCGGHELLTNGVEHQAAFRVQDKELVRALAENLEQKDPWVLLTRPAEGGDAFVEQSLGERASERRARKFAYILLGAALLSGVVLLLTGKGLDRAVCGMAAILCMGAPLSSTLIAGLASLRLHRTAATAGAVVPGWTSIEELGGVDTLQLDADELFTAESVKLEDIRIFKGGRIDRAILYAASVLNQSCNTLRGLFRQIIEDRTDILFPVKDLEVHSGLGFAAWCGNDHVLIGTRAYLEQQEIALPEPEYEASHSKNGELQILYLAVSGNLHAMFVLRYVGGRNTARSLAVLQKEGIHLLVRTKDPSLTAAHIAQAYHLEPGMVTVLNREQCARLDHAAESDEGRCCMYHLGGLASLTAGLQAAEQAQNAETSATTVQLVSVGFSVAIGLLLTWAGSIAQISVATVLMYQAAWSALSIAVCALKQHN